MYESYFKLATKPFELLPNPDFLYMSRAHRRAVMYLDYGISERAGFILLTGDIGTGKTTLIRNLLKKRDDRMIVSRLFNTRVDTDQLMAMIADDFGLSPEGKDKVALLRELNDFLVEQFARGCQPVLIIDEAQNLTADLLEEVRMLSNLETDSAKLLQIILVGQPELRETLASPRLEQLRQRISVNCNLLPLNCDETREYIHHRLEVAGNRDAVEFTPEALAVVHRYSKGIPRLINMICDFVMLSAFAEDTRHIAGEMVQEIIGDLEFDGACWTGSPGGHAVSDEQAEGGAANRRTGADDAGLFLLLSDVKGRLENLERDLTRFNPELLRDMNDRFASLENAFRFYVGETNSSLAELKKAVEKARDLNAAGIQGREEETRRYGGLLRRMFGG
ncbi:XrtA/PEP-CTERM system-associated ATPase [Geobacter sp.]|uniref:XrtA/PEP-CTERM system-associated ATPase n=1 Tax=Geobacter sp. TaxID=46610 RepID=UPI00261B6B21|nr:XrtA/PEP-CTERM system-associated ATPase [Geobacter sp.]